MAVMAMMVESRAQRQAEVDCVGGQLFSRAVMSIRFEYDMKG
jgi:hypothetical protein